MANKIKIESIENLKTTKCTHALNILSREFNLMTDSPLDQLIEDSHNILSTGILYHNVEFMSYKEFMRFRKDHCCKESIDIIEEFNVTPIIPPLGERSSIPLNFVVNGYKKNFKLA